MATVCSTIQQSLAWCQGTPELPGIKRRIYYISKDQIVSWPTLTYDALGDILTDKSQLTSDPQGEFPSQTQLNKLVAVHPSVGVEASALSAYVNNNDCVYLVETVRGKFRVVGSEKWQVKSTVAQDLGQGATGTTSTTLNVEATDECPAPFYDGEIVTEDGVINEKDDGGGGGTIIPWNPHDGLTPVDGTGNGKDNGEGLNNLNPSNLLNPSPETDGEGDDDGGGEDPNAYAAR